MQGSHYSHITLGMNHLPISVSCDACCLSHKLLHEHLENLSSLMQINLNSDFRNEFWVNRLYYLKDDRSIEIRAVLSFRAVGETRPVQESNLGSLLSSVFWTLPLSSRAIEKLLSLFGFRTIKWSCWNSFLIEMLPDRFFFRKHTRTKRVLGW